MSLWCKRAIVVWVAAAALASNGCGYALAGRGNFLPAYIRTIGIPSFENHTSFFQMAQLVTDKVRTEFIGRGNYKIVPEATGADAVLVGAVTNVTIVPTNFSAEQQASRYTITVTANIQLRDVRKTRSSGATLPSRFARNTTRRARLPTIPQGSSIRPRSLRRNRMRSSASAASSRARS